MFAIKLIISSSIKNKIIKSRIIKSNAMNDKREITLNSLIAITNLNDVK